MIDTVHKNMIDFAEYNTIHKDTINFARDLHRIIRLQLLVNIALSWNMMSKDASLWGAFDILTRGSIHQYQCNNPFVI